MAALTKGVTIEKCPGSGYMLTTEQREFDDRFDAHHESNFSELSIKVPTSQCCEDSTI